MINSKATPNNAYVAPGDTLTKADLPDLEMAVARCSGFVKMMAGVANKTSLTIMHEALDRIADRRSDESYMERAWQPHPCYRHKVKKLFAKSVAEEAAYRRRLLYPATGEVSFFHLDDVPEEVRRVYGAITDQQYFEFWEGIAGPVYQKSEPLVRSLQHKFLKSFQHNGMEAASQVAWGMTALASLALAVKIWQHTVDAAREIVGYRITSATLHRVYHCFSLERVAVAWEQALTAMEPGVAAFKMNDFDGRNIELGIRQMEELWTSADMPYDATLKAVEDYEEMFATQGMRKKVMCDLATARDEALD